MPKLRLHSPASIPGVGSLITIPGEDVSVGRSPENQLVIPDSTVSPRHARLQRTPSGWLLTDLGQTNGIWLGVRRVTEHLLCPGQLFRIGGVALEFVEDGAVETSAVTTPEEAKDATRLDPNPSPVSLAATHTKGLQVPGKKPQSALARRSRASVRKVAVGLGGLTILGFAVAVGGYVALRYASRIQHRVRLLPSATAPSAPLPIVATPVPPEALLSDKEVTDLSQEQQVDVPNVIRFVLPGGALHTPTHLVLARTGRHGGPFCNATEFAGASIEVSTLSNSVWAQPATLEFSVDVEQLAKTRVPAVAVGFFDATKQVWQLLPTEYDSVRRVAKAQVRQPGMLALFMVNGPENIATSEHFSLLLEPGPHRGKNEHERSAKALAQLEAALAYYRGAGFRVPNGSLWVCASSSTISRNRALLPVLHQGELGRAHSPALARAAFLDLVPAYVGARALDGREFWFDAMASAIAAQSLGQRMSSSTAASKRLASSLLADDWPSPALFSNVLARIVDAKVDLFRLWTDTTHVMGELDTKPNAELQSRVLPIDMALQEATQKNLLAYYTSFVAERLSGAVPEFCSSMTRIAPETMNGTLKLDVKSQYSAQWLCLSFDVAPDKYRSIRLQLAADAPPELNVQWLRPVPGQPPELRPFTAQAERIDLQTSQPVVVFAANSSMAQAHSISVRYEDVTLSANFEPPSPSLVRPGQLVLSTLQLGKIASEIKALDVEWDFGDGSARPRALLATSGIVRTEQPHTWDKPGAFVIRALVFDHDHPAQQLAFASRQITVQPVHLDLSTTEPIQQPSSEVRFAFRATGPVPEKPQYRINFGDGTDPSIVSSPEARHVFGTAGEYTVTCQLVSESAPSEVIASAKTVVSIRVPEAPSPAPNEPLQPPPVAPASSGSVQ